MSAEGGDKKAKVLPPMYDFIKEIRQAFWDIQHSAGGYGDRSNGGPADQTEKHFLRKYNITEPMAVSVLRTCTTYLVSESPGREPLHTSASITHQFILILTEEKMKSHGLSISLQSN